MLLIDLKLYLNKDFWYFIYFFLKYNCKLVIKMVILIKWFSLFMLNIFINYMRFWMIGMGKEVIVT